jgi:hypothetical protein
MAIPFVEVGVIVRFGHGAFRMPMLGSIVTAARWRRTFANAAAALAGQNAYRFEDIA